MKILIIGFFVFISWSAFSTYIYVCKIKGLCYDYTITKADVVEQKDIDSIDPLDKPLIQQITMPENLSIYFAYNKSEIILVEGANDYFDASNAYLEQNNLAKLSIIGHTDKIGTSEYNQGLGYRRAQSMQHYFENKGIPANRIIIESKGEKEPAADNNTKKGRADNRRTVITIKK